MRRLTPDGYRARPEQAIVIKVTTWDANCPQHIPQMFFAEDVEATIGALRREFEQLEQENARLARARKRPQSRRRPMTAHRSYPKKAGFRLGIYVFKDAEIVDFAAPYGVFSVARRFDAELDAFLIADAMRPVQAQAGFTVLPNYAFADRPAMDAFLIPGGFGTRQEMHNERLHEFVRALPDKTLITSVCTGSWIYATDGAARRQGGDQPQGARPARGLEHGQGADRPPGASWRPSAASAARASSMRGAS